METLIGRKYYPADNSYSECEDKKFYLLAGTCYTPHEEVEIISEPYEEDVESVMGIKRIIFVDVKCKRGLKHRVMYFENALKDRAFVPHNIRFGIW